MKEFRTLKYNLKINNRETKAFLKFLCHVSKNIYNNALYELRKQYFETGNICKYFDLNKLMVSKPDSKIMNMAMTYCINRDAHVAMSNFVYHKYKTIDMPKYKEKHGYYNLYIEESDTLRDCRVGNQIKFPLSRLILSKQIKSKTYEDEEVNQFIQSSNKMEYFYIKVPKCIENEEIRQLQIIPRFDCRYFEVSITYAVDKTETKDVKKSGTLAIDLGIDNLATCVNSNNNESFIIDGRLLKSKNQWINKQLAYYKSKVLRGTMTNNIASLYMRYNWMMSDYVYKSARKIIDYAVKNNVKNVVIGWNQGFKQKGFSNSTNEENARKNQNFLQIPLAKLKDRIKSLCEENSINYIEVDESYTSLCSFYDGEDIGKHDEYLGKRVERGLFKTHYGKLVNADVNGALNILKKSKTESDSTINRLMNSGLTVPYRIKVLYS